MSLTITPWGMCVRHGPISTRYGEDVQYVYVKKTSLNDSSRWNIYTVYIGEESQWQKISRTPKKRPAPCCRSESASNFVEWSVLEAYSRASKSHNTETKKQGLGLGRLHKKASEKRGGANTLIIGTGADRTKKRWGGVVVSVGSLG